MRTVLIGSGAALVLAAGATAAYAAGAAAKPIDSSGAIHGCYYGANSHGTRKLVLENVGTSCPSGTKSIKWNQKGPQGPSGVLSMVHFAPGATTVTGSSWAFTTTTPPTVTFKDTHTAAEVTATVDQASTNGAYASGLLGICYEPVGGSVVTNVSFVFPEFQAPAGSWFAQTVSGIVGGLTPGQYHVGMCQEGDSTNMEDGDNTGTIIVAESPSISGAVTHLGSSSIKHLQHSGKQG